MTITYFTPLFQRPQHIAKSFAKAGYLVLYLTASDELERKGFLQISPGLFLVDVKARTAGMEVLREIRGALISFYSTVQMYQFELDLAALRKRGNCIMYEYIDEISPEISDVKFLPRLHENYNYVQYNTFDLVAASATELHRRILQEKRFNFTRVILAQNAVDYEHYKTNTFSPPLEDTQRVVFDSLRRPIAGYFGAIAPWLWYELINNLTLTMQDVDFVMIGPDYLGGVKEIVERENMHILGPVPYRFMKFYASKFDVALIPFAQGHVAETTSPLKLYEYFALHKPVVASSFLPECTQYDVVLHGADSGEFAIRIRQALELKHDVSYITRVDTVAQRNTWDHRAHAIIEAYERRRKELVAEPHTDQ
jgi:hypothetical protein|tara:strand:+ start:517 stop:1617 length:1101 start_codon:yes stop_codon:yes gene_type:complete